MTTEFQKDPAALLDYQFDWTDWLDQGETISSYTIDADPGLTVHSDAQDGPVVTVWLSGGTAGRIYNVTCTITSSVGASPMPSPNIFRTDQRTIEIICVDR